MPLVWAEIRFPPINLLNVWRFYSDYDEKRDGEWLRAAIEEKHNLTKEKMV